MHHFFACTVRRIFFSLAIATAITARPADAGMPDENLVATYNFSSDLKSVGVTVCGHTVQVEGCFWSGAMGPFGHIGAVIEGYAANTANSVHRFVYVVDVAAGVSGTDVVLYRYKKTDTVTDEFDYVTLESAGRKQLPLVGGSDVLCTMAGNRNFLVIGTDKSTYAIRVTKGTLALQTIGGFSDNPTVTAITSNDYGYITVVFGTGNSTGFYQIQPDGSGAFDGGGADYTLTSTAALVTKGLVPAQVSSDRAALGVHPRAQNLTGSGAPLESTAP